MSDGVEDFTKAETYRRSKYGLGDRRTFDQLIEFSGVDPRSRSTIHDRCGNIDHLYVPFQEHVKGADYIPYFLGEADGFAAIDLPDRGSIYYKQSRSTTSMDKVKTGNAIGSENEKGITGVSGVSGVTPVPVTPVIVPDVPKTSTSNTPKLHLIPGTALSKEQNEKLTLRRENADSESSREIPHDRLIDNDVTIPQRLDSYSPHQSGDMRTLVSLGLLFVVGSIGGILYLYVCQPESSLKSS